MVGIFQPLVPAIAGAGVLKALMVLLSTLGLMSSGDIAYKVFVGVADAALYYLPVMVAFTTATKFNCNKLVSVALAAAMIHPSVSALLATEGGAYFLGIKLQNIAYGGQVFPAILTVIFMSFIEKWANKWCPKAIRVFFVPMLCFGIGFPVALGRPRTSGLQHRCPADHCDPGSVQHAGLAGRCSAGCRAAVHDLHGHA